MSKSMADIEIRCWRLRAIGAEAKVAALRAALEDDVAWKKWATCRCSYCTEIREDPEPCGHCESQRKTVNPIRARLREILNARPPQAASEARSGDEPAAGPKAPAGPDNGSQRAETGPQAALFGSQQAAVDDGSSLEALRRRAGGPWRPKT